MWQPPRGLRTRLALELQRRTRPMVAATPIDGGLGLHPLGTPPHALPRQDDAPPWSALAARAGRADPALKAALRAALDGAGNRPDALPIGDAAARLIHLAAVWAWTPLPPRLARALAGSARAQASWIRAERPVDPRCPTRLLCDAAVYIASMSWPAWPESAEWSGASIADLGRSAPATLHADGAPRGGLATTERAFWALALARAWAEANHQPLPPGATTALSAGVRSMSTLLGVDGRLPAEPPPCPTLLPLGSERQINTLRRLTGLWGLDSPIGGPDDALATLGVAAAGPPPPPMRSAGSSRGGNIAPWRGGPKAHSRTVCCCITARSASIRPRASAHASITPRSR